MIHNPFLLAIGGPAGSGKTTLAHRLRARMACLRFAEIVEDDSMRRALLGRDLADDMTPIDYSDDVSKRTLAALTCRTETLLSLVRCPVIDCSGFFTPLRQHHVDVLAQRCAVPFIGLWLDVPTEILRERLKRRTNERRKRMGLCLEKGHASDADEGVLDKFGLLSLPTGAGWVRIDAHSPQAHVDHLAENAILNALKIISRKN